MLNQFIVGLIRRKSSEEQKVLPVGEQTIKETESLKRQGEGVDHLPWNNLSGARTRLLCWPYYGGWFAVSNPSLLTL